MGKGGLNALEALSSFLLGITWVKSLNGKVRQMSLKGIRNRN